MKYKVLLFAWLTLIIPAGVMAEDSTGDSFPYGLLKLRGYPMEMRGDGTFRIYSGSTTFVEGTFSIEDNKITILDRGGIYACRGKRMNPGSYYWTAHDQKLYLRLIRDNCGARRTAFLEAPLKISLTAE
jgi:hypothetical protein